jgi:hypothetical protein
MIPGWPTATCPAAPNAMALSSTYRPSLRGPAEKLQAEGLDDRAPVIAGGCDSLTWPRVDGCKWLHLRGRGCAVVTGLFGPIFTTLRVGYDDANWPHLRVITCGSDSPDRR